VVRPLVRFCLRNSIKIQELSECIKVVFLDEAKHQLEQIGEQETISRLAVMTGMHRRDVSRLLAQNNRSSTTGNGLIMNVIGQWRNDKRYQERSKSDTGQSVKQVKRLSYGSSDSEFNKLVALVSKDLNPATVLFELERVGAVKRCEDQSLELLSESYIPRGDVLEVYKILSEDLDTLSCAVEENMLEQPIVPNHHLRTSYDKIRVDNLPEIKEWFLREGHAFHLKARNYLSQFDQDINPDCKYSGKFFKVVCGSFSKIFGR
jgi:hypothetical protein